MGITIPEEIIMIKNVKLLPVLLLSGAIALTGCSSTAETAQEATEYVNDAASTQESTAADTSVEESSTVILQDLVEPLLEIKDDAVSTDAATEAFSIDRDTQVEVVFFGDSQIANGRDDGTDIPTLTSLRVPNTIMYNLAIGGTTATLEKTTSSIDPATMVSTSFVGLTYCLAGTADRNATLANYPKVLNTMNSIEPGEVDYYIIEYGANDFINGVPLDNSMYDADQLHSVYNAMCVGIETLKSISPKAKFIIMTPFYGIYVDGNGAYIGDSYIVSNGIGTLSDYAKKIQNVAEDKGAIIFDDMFKSKCDLYLDTANEYLMDNLHLSLKGRQIFARLLAHQLNFEEHNEPYAYLEGDFIKIAEFDPNEDFRYNEAWMQEFYPESWEKYVRGEFPLAQPSEWALEQAGLSSSTEASSN